MAVPVPCGDHRCLQERKQLRKELEKGRKNVIAYIGLECITESLFGSEFFQKISPFKDEERKATGDWDSQQENCILCAVRQEAVAESIANHQAYLDRLEDGGSHLSHRDRVLKAEQWLAQSVGASIDSEEGDQKAPLDLSKAALLAAATKAREVAEAAQNGDEAQEQLRVPSITVHRPTTNNKKPVVRSTRGYGSASYTQDDLRLALQEVRKGKVGTRRAAMLYGIPRSTIRNHLNRHSFLCEDEDASSQEDSKTGIKRSKLAKTESRENGSEDEMLDDDIDESDPVIKLRSFLRNRNAAEKAPPVDLESSLSEELIKELALNCTRYSKTKTLDVDSLRQECLSTSKNVKNEQNGENDFTLPEYIFHVLIQRHLESEKKRVLDSKNPLKPALRQPAAQPNVDLKVPRYKPMNVSTDTQASDLDNGVASWIKPDPDAAGSVDWKNQFDNLSDSRSSSPFSEKRYSNSQDACNANKRPKRGRYRCYDRDALMQAVGAVQRGEMTVTRAGNVFGVPHSTLEYKVKERHLKRSPKKQAPKVPKSEPTRTESHRETPTPTYSALNMYDASHISPFAMATRPFESFAERLRAMSEKQAMQNSYGYLLKQSLENPAAAVGVVMQDLGQMQSALQQQQASPSKDVYPSEEQLNPLLTNPAVNPMLLGKQQWVWALHPTAAAAYQQTYKEALQQQQVLYGLQQDKAASAAAAAASGVGNASVSDAINRLVEAHIYDSLYGGKSASNGATNNKSASSTPKPDDSDGEPGTSGENNSTAKRSSEKDEEESEPSESKRPRSTSSSKDD